VNEDMIRDTKWALPLLLSLGLLLAACPADDDDTAGDDDTSSGCPTGTPPTADIIQPTNTAEFESGAVVHFLASVADNEDSAASLETHWFDDPTSEGEEAEFNAPSPDADGIMEFDKADFIVAYHIITLEVTDSDGCTGSEDIAIAIGQR